MESLLLVPSFGSQRHRCGCNYLAEHGPGPIRPRYHYRRRCQPAGFALTPSTSFLSHIFDDDDEPSLPSLLLRLRDGDRNKREVSAQSENKAKTSDNSKSPELEADKKTSSLEKKELTSDKFNVSMKLGGDRFAPEEISVKLVGRSLRVEAKHEKSGLDGHFSVRQICRSFHLPDDVDIESMTSALSSEGVLSIEAPKLPTKDVDPVERTIPIKQAAAEKAPTGKEAGPPGEELEKGETTTTEGEPSGEPKTGATTTTEGEEETAMEEGKESAKPTTEGISE